jgi:hypothetical protein
MSEAPQKNIDDQEIDLTQISKKIGLAFENFASFIFKGFLFLKRNIIAIGILFVLGAVLGFYLDKEIKIYNNQIIVSPNFDSNDYLYAKIDLISSKINENDTLFLKEVVGIKEPNKLKKISIKPISDVYKFIENKPENFELIKLMAENGDIKKIIEDNLTSKNYPYHHITYTTENLTSDEKTVQPLMYFLNHSEYYSIVKKESVSNLNIKIKENDSIISQINNILNGFSKNVKGSGSSDKLVYYNENTQLNDVIKTKDELIQEQGYLRLKLLKIDRIVKGISVTLNIKNNDELNGKMKLFLPILFILMFIFAGLLKSYYKKQMNKLI